MPTIATDRLFQTLHLLGESKHYSSYHSSMYMESTIPTLGEVRGKIVILSEVSTLPGIPYSSINVQDGKDKDGKNIGFNEENKKSAIVNLINESTKSNRNNDTSEIYLRDARL